MDRMSPGDMPDFEPAMVMVLARVSGRRQLNDPWSEPYDFFTPNTSSDAIRVRHANAQPIFRPVRMLGNAAGIRILLTYLKPPRP